MSRPGYIALQGGADIGNEEFTDVPPVFVETGRGKDKGSWSRISDLDDFFKRVYRLVYCFLSVIYFNFAV